MQAAEALVPITMFAGGFAMVFGIVYLRTRQNLAMIEKGMNPRDSDSRPAPYKNLKWGLLLLGSGIGLLAAFLLDAYVLPQSRFSHNENPAIYFSLIAIGGGLGLLGSYRIEKRLHE